MYMYRYIYRYIYIYIYVYIYIYIYIFFFFFIYLFFLFFFFPISCKFWFLYFAISDWTPSSLSQVKVGKFSIRSSNFIHKIGITLRALHALT